MDPAQRKSAKQLLQSKFVKQVNQTLKQQETRLLRYLSCYSIMADQEKETIEEVR